MELKLKRINDWFLNLFRLNYPFNVVDFVLNT